MAENFRQMLENFYNTINKSKQAYIYKAILSKQLDAIEEQPMHVIYVKEKPVDAQNAKDSKKHKKPPQYIYKSYDFPTIFLFAFFRKALQNQNIPYFKDLHTIIISNLIELEQHQYFKAKDFQIVLIDELFDFFHLIKAKSYDQYQTEKLLKEFFIKNFQTKGLRRQDVERFGTLAQKFVVLLLYHHKRIPNLAQLLLPTSAPYETNMLNITIILIDHITQQQRLIGKGNMKIRIKIYDSSYLIEKFVYLKNDFDQELGQKWIALLQQSKKIRKKQGDEKLEFNQSFDDSRQYSAGSPKSVRIIEKIRKNRYNFFNLF